MKPALCASLAAPFLLLATPAHADESEWDKASDIGLYGLMFTAAAVPIVKDDEEGFIQAGGSILGAWGVTYALKSAISEERPDGSDDRSFPSGHTSRSFAAAATLHNRYGWQAGLPAHAAAAFVGLARVNAKKHYVHDVIAGAAIGEAAGWLITRRKSAKVQFLPWGDAHGGGVTVSTSW